MIDKTMNCYSKVKKNVSKKKLEVRGLNAREIHKRKKEVTKTFETFNLIRQKTRCDKSWTEHIRTVEEPTDFAMVKYGNQTFIKLYNPIK